MLEAALPVGYVLRSVLESTKDLFPDTALHGSPAGITLQSMDPAHVAVVTTRLGAEVFSVYQCERSVSFSFRTATLAAVLRSIERSNGPQSHEGTEARHTHSEKLGATSSTTSSSLTLRYDRNQDPNTLYLDIQYNAVRSMKVRLRLNADAVAELVMIPEQNYKAIFSMPSAYLLKVCRDFAHFAETMSVEVYAPTGSESSRKDTYEGTTSTTSQRSQKAYIEFSTVGDLSQGAQRFGATRTTATEDALLQATAVATQSTMFSSILVDEDEKQEQKEGFDPFPYSFRQKADDETQDPTILGRQKAPLLTDHTPLLPEGEVTVLVREAITLTFALRYISAFARSGKFANMVTIRMAKDTPCAIEFHLPQKMGTMQFFLAPKIQDA